ncbi:MULTISPECIES: helix-turn-helix transcriptional regulator [Peptoniphilus]|uniref:helix-turn-helix transcriptional regulator n=1 Tax=Peptoniphilus TaxID=162289 RepID=UPI00235399F2|nr:MULTISPECIES: helix-turn-helix domain-containing protein [Peptoniphilus]MBS6611417.1 helix-turn-helix domain-containing protein [Peptoniphilus harei]MDU1044477.1 helix-turn-helix domain-containing protein [Peptoniphilus rhinitidis]MDU2110257.1 helix-turn-helix domain-containing protein [Peptoniphilus lacydonensis]MDU3751698.1 helix-turn-helix domain-containing protein [Peptoniphilus rhinitidis]MDU5378356.1 helix-turn-helix domain-containing protein [Peptoniphilus lacydonensis]
MKNRIKQIRKEKGLTQEQLANGLSVTRQYISLLERGEAQATISVGIEIANKLDTCIYTLFGFDKFECEQCRGGAGGN